VNFNNSSLVKLPEIKGISGYFRFILSFLFIIGCTRVEEPVFDNHFDPEYKNFVQPHSSISNNIRQDSVLNTTSIYFTWKPTNEASSYSYYLKGFDENYSEWVNYPHVSYTRLDEGTYTFMVKERYNPIVIQQNPDTLRFTIDAIKDCALGCGGMYLHEYLLHSHRHRGGKNNRAFWLFRLNDFSQKLYIN